VITKRGLAAALFFSFGVLALFAAASDAQSGNNTADASSLQQQGSDWINEQFGPFKFTAGPDSSGDLAANLDGKGQKSGALDNIDLVENVEKFWLPAFYNVAYSAGGTWSSDAHSARNATLSLKPGIDTAVFHGAYEAGKPAQCSSDSSHCGTYSVFPSLWLGLGAYTDLQYRYGTVQQNGGLAGVNQFNAGGGMYAVGPWLTESKVVSIDSAPRLSATYYHPVSTSGGTLTLPNGIKADTLQTEFHIELGLWPRGALHADNKDYPFKLDILYDGTKPTTGASQQWQNLWKLQLYTNLLKLGSATPAITYQTGKQAGFSYDHQVILGVLVRFLDPGSPNTKSQ
jgi:hypothetical protein